MTTQESISRISDLHDGQSCVLKLLEESGAEIWLKNDTYFLFEIPQYGGQPTFCKSFRKNQVYDLVKCIESWT